MLVSFLGLADGAGLLEVDEVCDKHRFGIGVGLGPAEHIVELVDGLVEAAGG